MAAVAVVQWKGDAQMAEAARLPLEHALLGQVNAGLPGILEQIGMAGRAIYYILVELMGKNRCRRLPASLAEHDRTVDAAGFLTRSAVETVASRAYQPVPHRTRPIDLIAVITAGKA